VDMHVHIVGNGDQGSECWFEADRTASRAGRFMLRHIRLDVTGFDDPEFDRLYVSTVASTRYRRLHSTRR